MHICDNAGVTRGALAHHFGSKRDLFAVILEDLCRDAAARITDAISGKDDFWDKAQAGIAAFVDATTQPMYQAIVVRQAPIALGWQRRRDLVAHYYGDLMREFRDTVGCAGLSDHAAAMLVSTMRGTMTELCSEITQSKDQESARHEACTVVERLLGMLGRAPISPAPGESVAIGQLRTRTSTYLDRVEAGETLHVTRGGRVVGLLQQPR